MFLEDFCASQPCLNGGKCDNNIDDNGYECFCIDPRYRGKQCEISTYGGKLQLFPVMC